ncbi:MAG TPA: hypothetical protein VF473_10965 [Cyclobacteriaceae bacterium]
MNRLKISRFVIALAFLVWSCDQQNSALNPQSVQKLTIDVAQTSGQLASGTNFNIQGSSSCDSTKGGGHGFGEGPHGHFGPGPGIGRNAGILDGLNLIAPTDELLAIVDAESASDIRGLRVSKNGGATITNYDASGNVVSMPLTGDKHGPQGCSFSGKQFPATDSLLAKIVKTVIDFGSGVRYKRDTVEIVRSGKIVIARTKSGSTITETTTFDNYKVNGIKIAGTKTRTSTFEKTTGSGTSKTSVSNGQITFTDGTAATWTSERSRVTNMTAGTITNQVNTSVVANGTTIYSHKTTTPLLEKLNCEGRRPGPVSGVVATVYRTNNISIDFGNGSCTNRTVTITVNGTTTTRTIGE